MLCAGGISSQIAPTLVRKGVGRITLLNNDIVELSNLNCQRFYIRGIGQNKAISLAKNLTPECIATTEQLQAAAPILPKGPFQVIVADPQWQYDRDGSLPYPTMGLEDIKGARARWGCPLG